MLMDKKKPQKDVKKRPRLWTVNLSNFHMLVNSTNRIITALSDDAGWHYPAII
jgi:hypothetical protein